MNNIELFGEQKAAPSNWNEMTAAQLITWMKVCDKKVDPAIALMFCCCLFYGIKKRTFLKLNAAEQIQLAYTLNFLLKNELCSWLFPAIKVSWFKTLLGPQDFFSTCPIKEFSTAEMYYHAYLAKKDEAMLDLLIATLYRPASKKNNGKDLREIFTEVSVLQRAPLMAKLDPFLRQAILFNYEGVRTWIMARYPTIFKKCEGEPSGSLPDLSPVIKTFAGGKFGHYGETEQADLYVFLDHWKDEQEAYEKAKSEQNKH